MTKSAELRESSVDELSTQRSELKRDLFNLRFQHKTQQLDNTSKLGVVRKQIARISTLLRERELPTAKRGVAENG